MSSPHDFVGDLPLSTLEADLRNIIERDLPRDLSSLFDIEVETKVLETKYTSLTIFFGAMIAAYPLIASYQDFVEGVHLIKKHCRLLVDALDRSKYGNSFDKSVDVYYPTMPDPTDYSYRWARHLFGHPEGEMFAAAAFARPAASPARRDLFFWYLVVMNILLIALVGSLVFRSVVSTYFEQPRVKTTMAAPAAPSRTTAH